MQLVAYLDCGSWGRKFESQLGNITVIFTVSLPLLQIPEGQLSVTDCWKYVHKVLVNGFEE